MPAAATPEPSRTAAAERSPACLYCGSADLERLYTGVRDRLGHVPGEREFWRCGGCGSAVLVPLPRSDELAAFYPPVYSFTLELGGSSRLKRMLSRAEYHLYFRPQYAAQTRAVMRACGWKHGRGKKLLDVGCGRGLRLLEFRRTGFDVHGLDLQPDVVRYLTDDLSIPAVCADANSLTDHFDADSFDVITAFQLSEHLPDVRGFIVNCVRCLRPNGRLVLATPLFDCVQAKLFGSRWINVREAPRHVSLATSRGLRRALTSAGLDDVTVAPDSSSNCAGLVGLTLVPQSALTHTYADGAVRPLVSRALAAGVMAAAWPAVLVENYVLDRPSVGIVTGRKPPR